VLESLEHIACYESSELFEVKGNSAAKVTHEKMKLDKDYFQKLGELYNNDKPKVEKVAFGDVMFSLDQLIFKYKAKLQACEEMQLEYVHSDDTVDVCMKHSLQSKIESYQENIEDLQNIQNNLYKKTL